MPMPAEPFDPSPQLESFLVAEVRNEADGGVSPTTLGSALDSLLQMPEDVLEEELSDLIVATGVDACALESELRGLIGRFGGDFEVERHLSDEMLCQPVRQRRF